MMRGITLALCACAALLTGCGGGGSAGGSTPPASSGERTFAAQTALHGTTYSVLMTSGLRLAGSNGFFALSCPYADGGCDMGTVETDYSGGTVSRTVASDGSITLSMSSPGGTSTTMKLDSQWGMLQDPRGCTYSRPLQLPADIPLSVNNAYSTNGVSVTRTCPDGSSSTDTWYGRKSTSTTGTTESTSWTYDAFDASNVHSYQVAFSVYWDTAQNTLVSIMLSDIYDYRRGKGTLFTATP